MSDVVEHLRTLCLATHGTAQPTTACLKCRAADTIEALRSEVERLRTAHAPHEGHCPGCGTPVEVVSSDEGTSYYRPVTPSDSPESETERLRRRIGAPEFTEP